MAEISFDFQKYIAERRGGDDSALQSGMAYAYPGDQKVLRTLARVTPVSLAVSATVRLWNSGAGREMLASARKVTEQDQPELHRSACLCAERLGIVLPSLYLLPESSRLLAYTFGTSEDPTLVLGASLAEKLRPEELRFVIGHECGRVQSGHVVYMTALYYLQTAANQFVRWIVTPAVAALRAWGRRAEVSADRAGLICSGELTPSVAALCRMLQGAAELPAALDAEQVLRTVDQEGAVPAELRARVLALRLFSETHYFLKASGRKPREEEGKSLAWCDERTKKLLSRAGE